MEAIMVLNRINDDSSIFTVFDPGQTKARTLKLSHMMSYKNTPAALDVI